MIIFLFTIILTNIKNSSPSFNCDCGAFMNTGNEARECMQILQNDATQKFKENIKSGLNLDRRIVGGYDVDKRCIKRPSLALIKIRPLTSLLGEPGKCMGSIINKKFVLTAAHCFCNPKYGVCVKNNGEKTEELHPSGHFIYKKGTVESTADPTLTNRTIILLPGASASYSKGLVENMEYYSEKGGLKKVKSIIIHPEYVIREREQNDIALVEVTESFDFSNPLDVSPICLGSPNLQSDNVTSYVTGYGQIFEAKSGSAQCNTGPGGPSEFTKCKQFWVVDEEIYDQTQECSYTESPAKRDRECKQLRKVYPELALVKSKLTTGNLTKMCYPLESDGHKAWCATCLEDADYGEPGYCKPLQGIYDVTDDEVENRQDYSADRGWGYCDKMCYTSNVFNDQLQEAALFALSKEECDKRTKKYLEDERLMSKRPNPQVEICAAKRRETIIYHYKREGEEFTLVDNLTEVVWGGSDTCKGDSGGPLWIINDQKAFLTGVTNRGTGCARKDSYGIYARVSYHWDWIHEVAASGHCDREKATEEVKTLARDPEDPTLMETTESSYAVNEQGYSTKEEALKEEIVSNKLKNDNKFTSPGNIAEKPCGKADNNRKCVELATKNILDDNYYKSTEFTSVYTASSTVNSILTVESGNSVANAEMNKKRGKTKDIEDIKLNSDYSEEVNIMASNEQIDLHSDKESKIKLKDRLHISDAETMIQCKDSNIDGSCNDNQSIENNHFEGAEKHDKSEMDSKLNSFNIQQQSEPLGDSTNHINSEFIDKLEFQEKKFSKKQDLSTTDILTQLKESLQKKMDKDDIEFLFFKIRTRKKSPSLSKGR